jgi:hypothetical protein
MANAQFCIYLFPAMETDTAWQYKHVYTQLVRRNAEPLQECPAFCLKVHMSGNGISLHRDYAGRPIGLCSVGHQALSSVTAIFISCRKIGVRGLKDPGSRSMKIFYDFVQSIPWHRMRSDWPHSLFVSGRGTFNATVYPGGEDYATASYTIDSTVAAIYLPASRKVGVNMSRFRGAVSATWLDPSSGISSKTPSLFKNSGTAYFSPPAAINKEGSEDWVLVLKTAK